MRVYHYLSKEWALDDIRRRRLKLSLLDRLNDPFELLSIAADDLEFRYASRNWKREMARRYGLVCFSKKTSNPVQWSHYSDHHSGICLGFDVPDDVLIPVSYVGRRVMRDTLSTALSGGTDTTARATMLRVLATKYSHWRYEAEVRAFYWLATEIDGNYFADFGPDLQLREVLVGALSNVAKNDVYEALGELEDVTVAKMRLAFKTFSVVKNRNQALWR